MSFGDEISAKILLVYLDLVFYFAKAAQAVCDKSGGMIALWCQKFANHNRIIMTC